MIDYMKFWLAKEIVSLWPLVIIFGGFGLLVLGCVVADKLLKLWRRLTR